MTTRNLIRQLGALCVIVPLCTVTLFLIMRTGTWCEFVNPVQASEDEASQAGQGFAPRLRRYLESRRWKSPSSPPRVTRQLLEDSLRLGTEYMVRNQKPGGNFNYQYDFVAREMDQGDSPVRQAGALWGLASIHLHRPSSEVLSAVESAIKFFARHTKAGLSDQSLAIDYPDTPSCKTGTVALCALGLIEVLRAEKLKHVTLEEEFRLEVERLLAGYLAHIQDMRLPNLHFADSYNIKRKKRSSSFSAYFDGESLLCLTKAAKYLGRRDLIPLIEESSLELAEHYTFKQWPDDPDSNATKGFFQWSCMAFGEYHDAGWKNAEVFGDYVLSLSWWMIHTHRTLARNRNTGYAYEGIVPAYAIAKKRGLETIALHLRKVIDSGLYKLTSWQVAGPLESKNDFLSANPTQDPLALGGIMNHRAEPLLRIDVAQHQMHALLLALEHVYRD